MTDIFKLYWFNIRTGEGSPAKDFPGEYTFEDASSLVKQDRVKQSRRKDDLELHYEPLEVFLDVTIKNLSV